MKTVLGVAQDIALIVNPHKKSSALRSWLGTLEVRPWVKLLK
jgi:hypothetical protein